MNNKLDPVMAAVCSFFEKSQLSLEELGLKMGYPPATARKRAWHFIHKTNDPRVSTLRRFTQATGVGLSLLLKD
jgi:hypothetical protein